METVKYSLEKLENAYGAKSIPYSKLLLTVEWRDARNKIVKRDGDICKKCGKGNTVFIQGLYYWIDMVEVKDSIDLKDGWGPMEIVIDEMETEVADKSYQLEVHHKHYIANKYPWQYPDDALITLCNWCHQEVHNTTSIPYYNHEGEALNYTACSRCSGSGSFPEYSHVQSGVCFRCGGARYDELIVE
ncbi:MAG: hypothetical protein ACRYFX_02660 [Janthinobacterium lividum]